jgi:hypothetical protein
MGEGDVEPAARDTTKNSKGENNERKSDERQTKWRGGEIRKEEGEETTNVSFKIDPHFFIQA